MLRYTRYPEHDFTHFVGEGEVPLAIWLEVLKAYSNETPTQYELADLRGLTSRLSDNDIRQFLTFTEKDRTVRPLGSKTALVVTHPEDHWAARFYRILSESLKVNWRTEIFSSVDRAWTWLGLDPALRSLLTAPSNKPHS